MVADVKVFNPALGHTPAPNNDDDFPPAVFEEGADFLAAGLLVDFFGDLAMAISLLHTKKGKR